MVTNNSDIIFNELSDHSSQILTIDNNNESGTIADVTGK